MKDLIAGRFEPVRLLGVGGTSSVFLVRDTFAEGQRFALKRIPRELAALAVDEFRRLCSLSHPGIPRAHEVGIDPSTGSLFFTSEFVEGVEALRGLRSRPLETQLEAVAEVLRILDFLHDRGVVHRDLKPANVLVQCADSDQGNK